MEDEPTVPVERRLKALRDAAHGAEADGHLTASRDNVELIEEYHGELTVFLEALRVARRHHLRNLHRTL